MNYEIDFSKFVNKYKDEKCVIIGASHSMHDFDYENFKGIKIILGTAILRTENRFEPDFLISSNNHFPVPEIKEHLDILNKHKNMTWIFSDTSLYHDIWTKSDDFLNKNLKIKYSCFDDKHFNGKKCFPKRKCCNLSNQKIKENIFDYLVKNRSLNNKDFKFGKGVSVAESALAVAILMGFKNIYLQGISLTLSPKYKAVKNKNIKYYGYQSKSADEILEKTIKQLRMKFFYYYLKRLNFFPYIKSAYEKTINILSNKGEFRNDYNQAILNFENLAKISLVRSQKIFVTNKNSNLYNIENIHLLN